MEAEPTRPELVRCLACHAVYEQAAALSPPDETATCPECGDGAWLAAWVPVEETGAAVPA